MKFNNLIKKWWFWLLVSFVIVILFFSTMYLGWIGLKAVLFATQSNTYISLEPEESLINPQESADIIKQRLNTYGLAAREETISEDILVFRTDDDIVGDRSLIDDLFKIGQFQAKIGNEIVFQNQDVIEVCRKAQCSGLDPRRPCEKIDGQWTCSFFFAMTISPEAAQRHATVTKDLEVITKDNYQYLSQPLTLYLDDEKIETLRIGAELKGRDTTDIQISGSASGLTREEAVKNTFNKMKIFQILIQTQPLPTNFKIVSLETIKN